jgi:hypothetical protein
MIDEEVASLHRFKMVIHPVGEVIVADDNVVKRRTGSFGHYEVTVFDRGDQFSSTEFTVEDKSNLLPHLLGGRGVKELVAAAADDRIKTQTLIDFIGVGPLALSLGVLGARVEYWDDESPATSITNVYDADECCWTYVDGLLLGKILNQCLCGMPWETFIFVFHSIEHLGMPLPENPMRDLDKSDRWKNRMAAVAKYGDGPLYYIWHSLEHYELLEHGSSAPGHLTGKGEHFLELMKYAILEEMKSRDD